MATEDSSACLARVEGSGTVRKMGSENSAHHTATAKNDALMAGTVPLKPNIAGCRIHARLISSNNPPPM